MIARSKDAKALVKRIDEIIRSRGLGKKIEEFTCWDNLIKTAKYKSKTEWLADQIVSSLLNGNDIEIKRK